MSLVPLLSAAEAAVVDRAMVDSGVEQYGQVLHTWAAILNRPGLFSAYLPFLRAVAAPGSLDPRIKDLSALLVGHLNGCRYTVSHRYASATRSGASDDLIGAVVAGEWATLEPALQVALELTRGLTLLPVLVPYATAPQVVDDTLLAKARAQFDSEQLVELTMSISVWNALSRFHRVMGFDLDMPPAPPGVEPE